MSNNNYISQLYDAKFSNKFIHGISELFSLEDNWDGDGTPAMPESSKEALTKILISIGPRDDLIVKYIGSLIIFRFGDIDGSLVDTTGMERDDESRLEWKQHAEEDEAWTYEEDIVISFLKGGIRIGPVKFEDFLKLAKTL